MMQSKIKYLSSVCVSLGEEEPKCSNRGDRIPSESQHRATTTKVLRRPQNNTNVKPHSRTANQRRIQGRQSGPWPLLNFVHPFIPNDYLVLSIEKIKVLDSIKSCSKSLKLIASC
jgi:hypothetical protein